MTGPARVACADDRETLRAAFGAFATGVTVVTVGGPQPRGMTANSFTSVSLDPPLVLVCVGREAVMNGLIDRSPSFAVSVLAADQRDVAVHFADRARPDGAEQFAGVPLVRSRYVDAPLIAGAVAHFACESWRHYDGGDHVVHLGRVLEMSVDPDRDSLGYHRGLFTTVAARPTGAAA
ncbi:flavin reductase [Streptomyces spiramenti]|uniref:Flavin reductase family protein n=1 Tax=Streptomyces spiramenti TaxID=2720606 RepID=A0ABX1ALL6_9ACTN|nr:flavin reductase family protein [Streptomyces spiramenti]